MIRIFAHRGSHGRPHIENTLEAFRLAIEEGADGVEFDVRTTWDGQVVVFHDADLSRLAGDPRRLADIASKDLPPLSTAHVRGAEIPTLDAVLDLVLGAGLEVNVELKADGAAAARVIGARPEAERAQLLISSFLTGELDAFAAALPRIRRALLLDLIDERRSRYLRAQPDGHGVYPHRSLCTPERVREWKAQGLFVNAWTVNDPATAVALASMGLDALVTDDVPALREACRSLP